ncbi:hypothetical protein CALCODRAFT_183277 [Calocera cornea HHB12733]|uniref:Uncharacterized protein n=1 Tax=Calocera cornea HHB12733 TaxID=1353952 RepID=A0A165CB80_9BASI|nr:hypothetical protein CALCODRAFT_183277 [Calocera cornea HHB12733]
MVKRRCRKPAPPFREGESGFYLPNPMFTFWNPISRGISPGADFTQPKGLSQLTGRLSSCPVCKLRTIR